MVELLAPAGSEDALKAAVEAGADAVYLAGNMFGARAYAGNFDEAGLARATEFAHARNVAVHVAANTAIHDAELAAFKKYVRFLADIKADAVLVQDLGAAMIVREEAPALALHASTQMTVHNLDGVRALSALGFSRVVLARELSLGEIRDIVKNSAAEIEIFMHGALCVCYSGACLMSSLIGARSGNRGRCAQPCRLPYELVDEKGRDVLKAAAGKYLLSPRDLNTIDVLPELIRAGVSSLKIEGRMKRPEYVATVVSIYRKAIDRFYSGEKYFADESDERDLAQIFNRGFTHAYLFQNEGREMMSDRRPNNRGLLAGRVKSCDRAEKTVTVKLAADISVGDEVEFWVKTGGRFTAKINELFAENGAVVTRAAAGDVVRFAVSRAANAGDRVFKVYDTRLAERARTFFSGAPVRRVPVDIFVRVREGEPLFVSLTDADGNTAEAATGFVAEKAAKHPLTEETIRKQLLRLGGTIFEAASFVADVADGIMVPLSEINEARRNAVMLLEQKRLAAYGEKMRRVRAKQNAVPTFAANGCEFVRGGENAPVLSVAVDTAKKARAAIAAGADAVLFGGDSYGHEIISVEEYRETADFVRAQGKKIYFNTPRIVPGEFRAYVEKIIRLAAECADALYVHNIGTLYAAKETADVPLCTDWSLVCFNARTLRFFRTAGAAGATLSPELNFSQLEAVAKKSPLPLECIVGGRLELMVSKYCAVGAFVGGRKGKKCGAPCQKNSYFLKDRKGVFFPLATDGFCQMHILNSKPLSVLPHTERLKAAGIQKLRLELKSFSAAEISAAVKIWRAALDGEAIATEEQDVTRGHYFRGVE